MSKKYIYNIGNGFVMMVKKRPNNIFLLDRSEALRILGITQKQDDEMQLKLKHTNSNRTQLTEDIINMRKSKKAIYDKKRYKKLQRR